MLTSNQILDLLKEKLGSDYRTGKELGIPQPRVSRIRNSGGILNDEQGLKAAQILGLKEEFILLSLAAERSQNSPVYSILKKIADKFEPKNVAAAVILCAIFTAPALIQNAHILS